MMYDVIVIGGGPSGIQASLASAKTGAKTLLIEKENRLGGILNQCIHNGFGLKYFKEELTGPEYAHKMAEALSDSDVTVMLDSFVTEMGKDYVQVVSPNGKQNILTSAIVLASGCRERTAGGISLTGSRPSGVYTAGFVQKMINQMGKLPGQTAVILGSGDIGLIMARRLTLEGVKVKMVLEIMPNTSGLARNVRQCLDDFNIPLKLSHTVTKVVGENKIKGLYYAQVDKDLKPIASTEKFVKCDTLLLSVGLVPENQMAEHLFDIDNKTKSAFVNQYRQTSCKNIFVSGNVLHIHDLADNATIEGEIAGSNAGLFALNKLQIKNEEIKIECGDNISYTIPQRVCAGEVDFQIFFRVKRKMGKCKIVVSQQDEVLASLIKPAITAGEMQEITVKGRIDKDLVIKVVEI